LIEKYKENYRNFCRILSFSLNHTGGVNSIKIPRNHKKRGVRAAYIQPWQLGSKKNSQAGLMERVCGLWSQKWVKIHGHGLRDKVAFGNGIKDSYSLPFPHTGSRYPPS
jgi:hypothetical protein